MSKTDHFRAYFSSMLSQRYYTRVCEKSVNLRREPTCLNFLMKNLSLNMTLQLNFSLKLTNFSFIFKLFVLYVVH